MWLAVQSPLYEGSYAYHCGMRTIGRCLVAALAVVLLVGGCGDEEPGPSGPGVGPNQESPSGPVVQETPESACPNQQDTVLNEDLREDEQDADMDGDGEQESVSVAKDQLGIAGCKGFLVVDYGDEVISIPVEDTLEIEFGLPDIVGFGEIDPFPGVDAMVRVNQGASTSFLAVYSAGSGSLVKVPFVDGPHPDGTFPYGGSVGHLDGVDCAGVGLVVSSSAVPEGDGYKVSRSFYVQGDAAMEFDDSLNEETVVSVEDLESLPEFAGEPFDTCSS